MRTLAAVTVVCATALAGVVPAGTAATAPKLRLVGTQPLVVRATVRGRLGATFRLPGQPCGKAFAIRATGVLGSRAVVAVPSSPCVPPPIR